MVEVSIIGTGNLGSALIKGLHRSGNHTVTACDLDPDALEAIQLDGHTAYRRDGRIQSVFWACDDLNYEVSSLTDDTPLLEIASSIGCP